MPSILPSLRKRVNLLVQIMCLTDCLGLILVQTEKSLTSEGWKNIVTTLIMLLLK